MIGVSVRDYDQIRLRDSGVVSLAPRVHVNHVAAKFKHHAAVIERRDFQFAGEVSQRRIVIGSGGTQRGRREKDRERQQGNCEADREALLHSNFLLTTTAPAAYLNDFPLVRGILHRDSSWIHLHADLNQPLIGCLLVTNGLLERLDGATETKRLRQGTKRFVKGDLVVVHLAPENNERRIEQSRTVDILDKFFAFVKNAFEGVV